MDIEQHKESLINQKKYYKNIKERLEREIINLDRLNNEIAFYEKQIEEAIKQGKKSFDPDRFLKPKKGKL